MDFGVGIATGVIFEVVKSVRNIAKEVKANKKAVTALVQRCDESWDELVQIHRDFEVNTVGGGPVYETATRYIAEFFAKLEKIHTDMESWTDLNVWDQITKRKEMDLEIQKHYQHLRDIWITFQTNLIQQALATGVHITGLVQSNEAGITYIQQTLVKWDEQFKEARIADQAISREIMDSTAKTVSRVDALDDNVGQRFNKLDEGIRNMHEVIAQLAQAQRTELEDPPEVRESRERLIRALEQYKGERPLTSVDPGELTVPYEIHRGDYASISMGIRDGQKVAIKRVNSESELVSIIYRRIIRESEIWQQLDHRNIVRFIGCAGPKREFPYMISEWMDNGNARSYVRNRAEMRPPIYVDIIQIAFVLDIAEGLIYLHSRNPPIIHGGLKASNILINSDGTACITDFALAAIAATAQPGSRPPPMRWAAPEVLEGKDYTVTSDVYSFASVIIEIITDADPFSAHRNVYYLGNRIRQGLRPDFPTSELAKKRGLTSETCALWMLLQHCWAARPENRPTMVEVAQQLRIIKEQGP